jgi:protein-tyrosine phosphatase
LTVSYDLAACRGFFRNDADELPPPCTLPDFRQADFVIGLKRRSINRWSNAAFLAIADRVQNWHVDDLNAAEPCDALPHLELAVANLIAMLRTDDLRS